MKTPIEVKDIRKGDVVRVEHPDDEAALTATEYRAEHDGHVYAIWEGEPHYLIDRPTPPVELPTDDHHFGWITAPGTQLGKPRVAAEWFFGEVMLSSSGLSGISRQKVTEWTPGTLVPKAALDALSKDENTNLYSPHDHLSKRAIIAFLTAVDEANGDRA